MKKLTRRLDYCLRCHRTLDDPSQKSCHCTTCGFNNFLSDRKKYWTLSPKLVTRSNATKKIAAIWMAFSLPLLILGSMSGLQIFSIPLLVFAGPIILWISGSRLLLRSHFPTPLLWTLLLSILIWIDLSHLESGPSNPWTRIGLWTTMSLYGVGILSSVALFFRRRNGRQQVIEQIIRLEEVEQLNASLPHTDRGNAKYCLKCFAPMSTSTGACPECEFSNIAIDRRIFWNKNPKILAIETTGKVSAVCVGLFFTFLTVFGFKHMGMGAGYALAMNVVFVYAVCLTFGKLSRHMPSFEPSKVWSGMFWILFVTMTPLAVVPNETATVKAGAMAACLLLAVLPLWWAKKFHGWKRHLQMADTTQ